ncbi:MAG: hypothetical protein PHX47_02615 [Candidatus ainarchaeum sp.]|nr:hypothetical protein [Candidatus ainarchaeum sp.]
MKLTKEQIIELKELRKQGKKRKDLAKMFNVCLTTIDWHTNEDFKGRFKEYQKKWYTNLPDEKKELYFDKRKEYQRIYHKNRYSLDPEFKKRQLECAKRYQKKNK